MTTVIIGLFTGKDVHPFRDQAHLRDLNQHSSFLSGKWLTKTGLVAQWSPDRRLWETGICTLDDHIYHLALTLDQHY